MTCHRPFRTFGMIGAPYPCPENLPSPIWSVLTGAITNSPLTVYTASSVRPPFMDHYVKQTPRADGSLVIGISRVIYWHLHSGKRYDEDGWERTALSHVSCRTVDDSILPANENDTGEWRPY